MFLKTPENTRDMSEEELRKAYENLHLKLIMQQTEINNLKAELEFLKSAFKYIPNALFVKEESGQFYLFSDEYGKVFDRNMDLYVGRQSLELDFFSDDEREEFEAESRYLMGKQETEHREQAFTFGDGTVRTCFYWMKGFEVESTGDVGLVGEIVDISDHKRLERELENKVIELDKAKAEIEWSAKIDHGTGLFNRYVFDEQTKDLIINARESKEPVSVMMADLDHFKRVNDTFGHLEGDRVLKDFAGIIRSQIRKVDVPIRYGGEEFLVFLPGTDLTRAKLVAERLREVTAEQMVLPDGSYLTVSIGVVGYDFNESREECIARADEALYNAKETGRNKVVVFASENDTFIGD